jgi:hypothetical protein
MYWARCGLKQGTLLWRTQLWENQAPSASGLVVWGGAADGTRVYYPLQQPGGGLKALDIKSGKVEWNAVIEADRRGQAGPASAIPGAVFTGEWDGILRAVGADGKVIWSFNAVQDFSTVSGVTPVVCFSPSPDIRARCVAHPVMSCLPSEWNESFRYSTISGPGRCCSILVPICFRVRHSSSATRWIKASCALQKRFSSLGPVLGKLTAPSRIQFCE